MKQCVLFGIALAAIIAAALYLRLPHLADRPMHNDEGVNTIKFAELWNTGKFAYNPEEYHGPTLYYLTWPIVKFSGAKSFAEMSESAFRMVAVVFGLGLILLGASLRKELGWGAVLWSGLMLAISPVMVFYSRYYIHEMLLVFFTLGAIACGSKYFASGHRKWSILTGAFLGLMWATKETWILSLAAAGGALFILVIVRKLSRHSLGIPRSWPLDCLSAFLAMFIVATLLFTGFFTNPHGIVDAMAAYKGYFNRGSGGHIHDHPFAWYLQLLTWSQASVPKTVKVNKNPVFTEMVILGLAAIGVMTALVSAWWYRRFGQSAEDYDVHTVASRTLNYAGPKTKSGRLAPWFAVPFVQFLALYTLLLTLIYCLIPYKTPWCVLGFFHGMILLGGFAAAWLIRITPTLAGKIIATLILLAPMFFLERQSELLNFRLYADYRRNPWVYAHTVQDIYVGTRLMNEVAAVHPRKSDFYAQVVTLDCWPLPYYLRGFPNIGYWPSPPQKLDGDVIIGDDELRKRLEQQEEAGGPAYKFSSFGLRPGVVLWICIRQPLWEKLQMRWATQTLQKPKS